MAPSRPGGGASSASPGCRRVGAAVGLLDRPGTRVADLGTELGISERQLRRRFHDVVGYGPKTLDRALRLWRFLTPTSLLAAPTPAA